MSGKRAAFTLVEIMVVVVIISMLAMVAVPAIQRIQRKSKVTIVANDFRVFAAAFDSYAQEFGKWPAESAAGVFPAGMDQRINKTAWLRVTPIGGQYNWDYNQFNLFGTYQAALTIATTSLSVLPLDVNVLTDLEHTIDSPNAVDWTTGNFRLGSGIVPLYLIQQ